MSSASPPPPPPNCGVTRSIVDFKVIGKRTSTDKIYHHGYHRFYPLFLEQYRSLITDSLSGEGGALIEIGIEEKRSIGLWLDYFPRAFFYGIDITLPDECGDRFRIFRADQSDRNALEMTVLPNITHPVFAIVDDGSHIPEHQIITFDLLFQKVLMGGGTYIIEDVEVSYWSKGHIYNYTTRYGYRHQKSIVEIFRNLVDDINSELLTEDAKRAQNEQFVDVSISAETRAMINTITFAQNCIIVTKKATIDYEFGGRSYRFGENL